MRKEKGGQGVLCGVGGGGWDGSLQDGRLRSAEPT